uniref:DUF1985 domain-containing protein n=1 Tax=Cucumis melo TaxID=3656 RepID=A0A9I9ED21_CUCME
MAKIPTQFLNFLLRKQCHTKKKTNILAFNFNGHIAEFELKDFCFVTGLKGHKFPKLNLGKRKENGLKNVLFRHDDFITRRDIERTFKALCNEEDLLKEKLQHNYINLLHLDILDNEEIFKGYPWGRLSYILTYQFLKKASYSDKDVVYLQGFSLALVYWAFEKIPRLSDLDAGFGRKLATEGSLIVTWECLETSDWRTLNIDIFEYENFSMKPLDSSKEESQTILRYFKILRSRKEKKKE